MDFHIVWNEEMTEGVVFKNIETAKSCAEGVGDNDLAEAFFNLHSGEVMTLDTVSIGGVAN